MKFCTALVVALLSILAFDTSSGQGQIYCGRRLADTLAFLCENPLINRRSDPTFLKRPDAYNAIPDELAWPWIPHRAAQRMRSKRQVVSECCDKPCTMNELLAYCSK